MRVSCRAGGAQQVLLDSPELPFRLRRGHAAGFARHRGGVRTIPSAKLRTEASLRLGSWAPADVISRLGAAARALPQLVVSQVLSADDRQRVQARHQADEDHCHFNGMHCAFQGLQQRFQQHGGRHVGTERRGRSRHAYCTGQRRSVALRRGFSPSPAGSPRGWLAGRARNHRFPRTLPQRGQPGSRRQPPAVARRRSHRRSLAGQGSLRSSTSLIAGRTSITSHT